MKKILFYTAIILASLSCSKEDLPSVVEERQPLVFTGVIANPTDEDATKTSIDDKGKTGWVLNDEITISDGTNKAIYYVSDINEETKIATFTFKTGATLSTAGSYSAKYGNVNDQWYKGSNGAGCPMTSNTITAPSTEFEFTNDCGVFNISATASNIIKIEVGNGTTSYALNFATAISSMTAGTDYYMLAVPDKFEINQITFVKSDGRKYTKTFTSKSVAKNHLKKLKFTGSEFNTDASYTGSEPLALSGVFSVSATKKVRFSKGLVYNESSITKYSTDQLQVFGTPTYTGGASSAVTTNGAFFHKTKVPSNPAGWNSLTKDEFSYLLTTRTVDSQISGKDIDATGEPEKVYYNLRVTSAVVKDKDGNKHYGVLLFPDYYRFPQTIADKITKWEKDNKASATKRFYKYINYDVKGNEWADKYVFEYNDFITLEESGVVFLNGLGRYYNNTLYNTNEVIMQYSDTYTNNNSLRCSNAVIENKGTDNYLTCIRLVSSIN